MVKKMGKVGRNFLYNSAYQLLLIILPLVTTPYISRVLGKDMIGLYSYSYSIASYFGMFILLGLSNYGNRMIATVKTKGKRELSKVFCSLYAMQLLCGLFVSAIYFFYLFTSSHDITMGLILYTYLLSAILDINWFYFGLEEFKLTVTRNIIIKILSTIALFLFVKGEEDVYIYAFIITLGLLLSQCILFYFLPKYICLIKITVRDVLKHLRPNLVLFIPVIAVSIYKVMDKIMLGYFSTYAEVGIYESSEKLVILPIAFINALGTVMLPRTTSLISQGKIKESQHYLHATLMFSVFLSSALCFGIIAILPEFVPLFYGKGYEECISVISIVILSSIFLSWGNVIRTQYLIPMKKDNIYVRSALYGAVVNFTINLLLIFQLKSIGTAIGTLVAEAVVCIYQSYKVRKELSFKRDLICVIPFLLIGLTMTFICLNINLFENVFFNITLKVIVGSAYYIILSIVFLFIYKRKKVI